MTWPPQPPKQPDDRVHDENLDRLRDSIAFLVDAFRTLVRTEMDAGAHPVDALVRGLSMLESCEAAIEGDGSGAPEPYADVIRGVLGPVAERVGADRLWAWLQESNPALNGRSPLAALVAHQSSAVARAAEQLTGPLPPKASSPGGQQPPAAAAPPLLSADDFRALWQHGLLSEKLELIDGRIAAGHDPQTGGTYDLVFGPAHTRAAARLAVTVYSAVDAVLDDPPATAELLRRLSDRLDPSHEKQK